MSLSSSAVCHRLEWLPLAFLILTLITARLYIWNLLSQDDFEIFRFAESTYEVESIVMKKCCDDILFFCPDYQCRAEVGKEGSCKPDPLFLRFLGSESSSSIHVKRLPHVHCPLPFKFVGQRSTSMANPQCWDPPVQMELPRQRMQSIRTITVESVAALGEAPMAGVPRNDNLQDHDDTKGFGTLTCLIGEILQHLVVKGDEHRMSGHARKTLSQFVAASIFSFLTVDEFVEKRSLASTAGTAGSNRDGEGGLDGSPRGGVAAIIVGHRSSSKEVKAGNYAGEQVINATKSILRDPVPDMARWALEEMELLNSGQMMGSNKLREWMLAGGWKQRARMATSLWASPANKAGQCLAKFHDHLFSTDCAMAMKTGSIKSLLVSSGGYWSIEGILYSVRNGGILLLCGLQFFVLACFFIMLFAPVNHRSNNRRLRQQQQVLDDPLLMKLIEKNVVEKHGEEAAPSIMQRIVAAKNKPISFDRIDAALEWNLLLLRRFRQTLIMTAVVTIVNFLLAPFGWMGLTLFLDFEIGILSLLALTYVPFRLLPFSPSSSSVDGEEADADPEESENNKLATTPLLEEGGGQE